MQSILSLIPVRSVWTLAGWMCITVSLYAQTDYSHWNDLVDWDGITPWQNYLIISPAFMGPHALPVPHHQKGQIQTNIQVETRGEFFWAKGDRTYNPYTRIYIPFKNRQVAVEGFYVPVEFFKTSPEIRDLRRARDFSGEGKAAGDVYLSTLIQIVRDHSWLPDAVLGINLRTASGTQLRNARYTDAAGYYFDASFGKSLELKSNKHFRLRWYSMLGFYVWQTYDPRYRQNDAFLYGGGLDLSIGKWRMSHQLSGYVGYIGNGDHPVIYRTDLSRETGFGQIIGGYQLGINDFPFQALRLGIIFSFPSEVISE